MISELSKAYKSKARADLRAFRAMFVCEDQNFRDQVVKEFRDEHNNKHLSPYRRRLYGAILKYMEAWKEDTKPKENAHER